MQKISLVIPAYNEEKYIGACLESLQKYGTGLFEVLVVNNASTDKTAEIARSFSFVKVIDEPKKGLPVARQRGLDEAVGDIVAFIDADVHITQDWVSKIQKEFGQDKKLVCLSGPYVYHDFSPFMTFGVWVYYHVFARIAYFFTGYMLTAGNFASLREQFHLIGGFDQNIVFYGDDTDIARRFSKIGKVKFSMNFYVYTSPRRFHGQGILSTTFHYVANFFSVVFRSKPVTHEYDNFR